MRRRSISILYGAVLLATCSAPIPTVWAQAPTAPTANATPRQSGTVKAVTPSDLVLTTAAGQDFAVNLTPATKVLLVNPATRDLKSAQPGGLTDIAAGDKAIVSGQAGDTGQTLNASRVLLLKSGAIAAMHAEEQEAWSRSVGGIVKSNDASTGTLAIANGARTYSVHTTPSTTVRRYTGASVRFEDAVPSTIAAIKPGDQVQARGDRNADGTSVTAQEIVSGSFSNFSGVLTSVDPAASTVSLKDLATKKQVFVSVTPQSNLRHMVAGAGGSAAGAGGNRSGEGEAHNGEQAVAAPASAPAAGTREPGAQRSAAGGGARRLDLARIVNRLPTESLADLKPGEAVMIVASNSGSGEHPTAITLLSGVEQILAASPSGETTLSPWSLGSSEGEGGGEGAGGGAR